MWWSLLVPQKTWEYCFRQCDAKKSPRRRRALNLVPRVSRSRDNLVHFGLEWAGAVAAAASIYATDSADKYSNSSTQWQVALAQRKEILIRPHSSPNRLKSWSRSRPSQFCSGFHRAPDSVASSGTSARLKAMLHTSCCSRLHRSSS